MGRDHVRLSKANRVLPTQMSESAKPMPTALPKEPAAIPALTTARSLIKSPETLSLDKSQTLK